MWHAEESTGWTYATVLGAVMMGCAASSDPPRDASVSDDAAPPDAEDTVVDDDGPGDLGDAREDGGTDGGLDEGVPLPPGFRRLGAELPGWIFDVVELPDGSLIVGLDRVTIDTPEAYVLGDAGWEPLVLPFEGALRRPADLLARVDGTLYVAAVADAEGGPFRLFRRAGPEWALVLEVEVPGNSRVYRLDDDGADRVLAHLAAIGTASDSRPYAFEDHQILLAELGDTPTFRTLPTPSIPCNEFQTPDVEVRFDERGGVVAAHRGVFCDAESTYLRELDAEEDVWGTRWSSTTVRTANGLAFDRDRGELLALVYSGLAPLGEVQVCRLGDGVFGCEGPEAVRALCDVGGMQPSSRLAIGPEGGALAGFTNSCCSIDRGGTVRCTFGFEQLFVDGRSVDAPEGGAIRVVSALSDGSVFLAIEGQAYRYDPP